VQAPRGDCLNHVAGRTENLHGTGHKETARAAEQSIVIDSIFRALGDPTRGAMVEKISEGPISVSGLAAPFDMTLAAVMQHVQILEESGLVRAEKTGGVRSCQTDPKGLKELERWVRERRSIYDRRLDRVRDILRI
jgi:DNA-binding transcriptional ArsR family regulator